MENIANDYWENKKIKCLIVDDEPIAIDGLSHYIRKLDFLEIAQTCNSAIEADRILQTTEIDLMFLDINLPCLSGIDFLGTLKDMPLTILTTAYSEYALDGYRLNVVDYLLKPFSFQRFFQAALKAKDSFRSQIMLQQSDEIQQADIFVKQGNKYTHLFKQDILYVEGMQNYIKVHCKDETMIIHQTMSSIEQILPKNCFFRIHRSFIINVSYISSISGNRLFINGDELPVSPVKKEELFNRFIDKKLLTK